MNGDILLRAEDLRYTYEGGDAPALDGLSLRIRRGSRVALMGANGSGKSTFLLCCTGVCRPQGGRLVFDGEEVSFRRRDLLRLRRRVGIVFQDPDNQLFSASVLQEIAFGPLNLGLSPEEARREAEIVMERLGVTPFAHKPTHALSGGQKKLVSIADILVMRPELILFDEPAAALDPKHAAIVNRIIESLTAQGMTVLLSTHDVDYAYGWADEVILFHEGRVLRQGSAGEVLRDRDALLAANLQPPAVPRFYEALCAAGVLDPSDPCPRSMEELEMRLPHCGKKSAPV